MQIDKATVARIAGLARLKIAPEEAAGLEQELSRILDWVRQLDEADTSAAEPMTCVVPMASRMRPDVVTDGGAAPEILKNAPLAEDSFFVVPKVVE